MSKIRSAISGSWLTTPLREAKESDVNRRRLSIYLNDHLAASDVILARARASIRSNRGTTLADALEDFRREAADERRALVEMMHRLELRRARIKELAALTTARAGRLKLNGRLLRYSPLSRLEELELFAAGAAFKAHLWETLKILSEDDARLDAGALEALLQQARAQQEVLGSLRREWVHQAFS